jgi:hypothetical protein
MVLNIARCPRCRGCNGCTGCCHVVAVKELGLASFTGCPHLRTVLDAKGPGCGIYTDRPYSCRSWRCMWLRSEDWPEELRPDRCGIVVDENLDLTSLAGRELVTAQLWVLPGWEAKVLASPAVQSVILALLDPRQAKLDRGRIEAVLMRMAGDQAWAFHRNRQGQVERVRTTRDEAVLGNDYDQRLRKLMER